MSFKINEAAASKIALHAAKFPDSDVCGLLLGSDQEIQDAIPLSHFPLNSCFLHMALDVILLTLSKNQSGLKLIGFYDFCETNAQDEQNFQLQKSVLSSLALISKVDRTVYLRCVCKTENPNADNVQDLTVKESMNEFQKVTCQWDFVVYAFEKGNLAKLDLGESYGKFDLKTLEQNYAQGTHVKLTDMDDHFDDPARDFMNSFLVK